MSFKQLLQSITKKEWRFVGFFSLVVMFVTLLPLFYGLAVTPDNHTFTAMHFVSADDWFVYYSFIDQGINGQFLFYDLFSPISHLPVLRPVWLVVGFFAKILGLSAPIAFQISRLVLIPILLAISYLLISVFFNSKIKRKLSLVFLSFSSGLGTLFLYRLAKYPQNYADGYFRWPMDLWVPDTNTFLTMYTSAHFIAATILLFVIFLFTVLFLSHKSYWYAVVSGISSLLLFSFHPFQVVKVFTIIFIIFLVDFLIKKNQFWAYFIYYFIFSVISLPAILYYVYLMRVDLLTILRALQNINPTPQLHMTLISFGGLLVFSIWTIFILYKQNKLKDSKYLFLVLWVVVQFLLLYAPVNYQRRLALGIHFPLAVMTIYALWYWYENKRVWFVKNAFLLGLAGFLIFIPSTLFSMAADMMTFGGARELSYISNDERDGFEWLRQNAGRDNIVFGDVKTGNIIPAYGLTTTYVGHAVETPTYKIKKTEPKLFFEKNRDEDIEVRYLNKRGIDYIFYGKREKELGDYSPESKNYLQPVFESASVKIYKVL